jgi:hypothetical protein
MGNRASLRVARRPCLCRALSAPPAGLARTHPTAAGSPFPRLCCFATTRLPHSSACPPIKRARARFLTQACTVYCRHGLHRHRRRGASSPSHLTSRLSPPPPPHSLAEAYRAAYCGALPANTPKQELLATPVQLRCRQSPPAPSPTQPTPGMEP